ncbi:D-alanine--D-alanine ligase, partial [Erysipelothrix rhusiopathiae]|nr:D-alanine--D-alanine ligase [Erysipelothrix rhusiopathiae]
MNKLQVALVFGSINSEHDISVASAASVLEHFPKEKFDCVPLYIGKDGKWYTGNYTLDMMQSNKLEGHRELYLQFNYDRPGFI